MRRIFLFLAIAFLLVSVVLLAASRLLPWADNLYWEHAEETVGQVVGFSENGSGRRPLVSFVASDGDPYVFEAEMHSGDLHTGQMVTVRYFLTPNLKASLKTDLSPATLILGILGCVFLVAGLIPLFFVLRAVSLERQLRQYGTKVLATVTGITTVRHVTYNGRHPFVVSCIFRDLQGIGEQTAASGWIWRLPPGLKEGDTLPVLYDPYRPGHFLILEEDIASTVF